MSVLGFSAQGQIYEMYHQGFEAGEQQNYTIQSGTAAPQTTLYSGGSRALKMTHTNAETVVLLDTIDFSNNATLEHFSLEMMHICNVDPNDCGQATNVAVMHVKRPNQTTWVKVQLSNYYNTTEGSASTMSTGSFHNRSYDGWNTNTPNNTMWKRERFDFDALFMGVPVPDRKLQIRLTLFPRTVSGSSTKGWYLDDLVVKASPNPMVKPALTMLTFPDLEKYPSSRGAYISARLETTVAQGMCEDSIYVEYKVGRSQQVQRLQLAPISGRDHCYGARIPFVGYDTIVRFHLIAKDATTNHNTVYYPASSSAWISYHCVRGKENFNQIGTGTNTTTMLPFPQFADNQSEFVYDSVRMANSGFKAGAISKMTFVLGANTRLSHRDRVRIQIRNAANNYITPLPNSFGIVSFPNESYTTVYDGPMDIEACQAGGLHQVVFQDTFFYAGSDMIVRVTYQNASDLYSGTPVRSFAATTNKGAIYHDGDYASMGSDFFVNPATEGAATSNTPQVILVASKNIPLVYDAGVASFAYPTYDNPCEAGVDSLSVWLKNFGASYLQAIQISWRVDNGVVSHYNWTGNLAPGDSVRVRVTSNQAFSVGYHSLTAWVEDSLTSASLRQRDHEPYNDTAYTNFAACDGPYSGVRRVGGSGAHFATLEQCLYTLSRCGVNGPLTIQLAPGVYAPVTFPNIPGVSASNYIQFEPQSSTVMFRATTWTTALVDLQNAKYIRFKNIKFAKQWNLGAMRYLVNLGHNSTGCQFINCQLLDSSRVVIGYGGESVNALIYSGGADSLVIDGCTFVGGLRGVDITGMALDNRASGNKVLRSSFTNQTNNAIYAVNQTAVIIDSNDVNDVTSNASYVTLMQYCYGGSRLTRNKVFTSHGASAVGISDVYGYADDMMVVANNMIVCSDDGQANLMTTPMNLIKMDYVKVVFNSVKMSAPQRSNIAAATFGGGILNNCCFKNNIVSCLDEVNYAFNYLPNASTTNEVGNNIYYSRSRTLNKYQGTAAHALDEWVSLVVMDTASFELYPYFLNSTPTDLRTYNRTVRGSAVPIAEVTIDMFGTIRDTTAPCIGAFEFGALNFDFEVEALEEPFEEYCGAPSSIPVRVRIKNSGVSPFIPSVSGTATVSYQCGSQSASVSVTDTLPADGSHVFSLNRTLSLPSRGVYDTSYTIRVIVRSSIDPNTTNDTSFFTVISRYQEAAPTSFDTTVAYGASPLVTVHAGINTWNKFIYNNAPKAKSQLFWYTDSLQGEPFHVGNSLQLGPTYLDTTFYVGQKRDMGLVRITEVQLYKNQAGVTTPYPSWMNSTNQFLAVQISNVGDQPKSLLGDTMLVVSNSSSFRYKRWTLPDITLQPGQSLVLQYRAPTASLDSSRTIFTPQGNSMALAPQATANFGLVYYDGTGMADAVAFNGETSDTSWTNRQVPSYIWKGSGIAISSNTTAGVFRNGWPTTPTATNYPNSNTKWTIANATHPMNLGTMRSNLELFKDNGCIGPRAHVGVRMNMHPVVDIALSEPIVDEGCNLGDEPVSLDIRNFGAQACSTMVLHYQSGSVHCIDTVNTIVPSQESIRYTFSQLLPMASSHDTVFDILCWVEALEGDLVHANDTSHASVRSQYTPPMPQFITHDTVEYGRTLSWSLPVSALYRPVWYDVNHNVIDSAFSVTTPLFYFDDTCYVAYVASVPNEVVIGTSTTSNGNSNYPSAFNGSKKYVKEQYLFSADQLVEAGMKPGPITALSFYLDTIPHASGAITFSSYKVSIGNSAAATFTSGTATLVTGLTEVYNDTLSISNQHKGWQRIEFDAPFMWDGTSNLAVQVCFTRDGSVIIPAKVRYSSASNTVASKQDNNNDQCGSATATRSGNRPNILFENGVYAGCTGPEASIAVNVYSVPTIEGGIEWAVNPATDSTIYSSCDSVQLGVRLFNYGGQDLSGYSLTYQIDDDTAHASGASAVVIPHQDTVVRLMSQLMTPGRHTVKAVLTVPGDTIHVNDTITRTLNVRFCAGHYSIGGTSADYPNVAVAIDTLRHAGVAGAVTFDINNGTYSNQLLLEAVDGASVRNTVRFRSASGVASDVVLTHNPTNAANYVVKIDGASYISLDSLTIYAGYASGSGNNIYANALVVSNSSNLSFNGNHIVSKATSASSTNASAVVMNGTLNNIALRNNVIDSGYSSLKVSADAGSATLLVEGNTISKFWCNGIWVREMNDVTIRQNTVTGGMTVNKPLTGIYVANNSEGVFIERNAVSLVDNFAGIKRGLVLANVRGTSDNKGTIYNNMISVRGGSAASANSVCIFIDSSSQMLNIFFNSANLKAGTNAPTSSTVKFGNTCLSLYVMNNIFANHGQGYAYYVTNAGSVVTSNYNDYYSSSMAAVPKFAFWGADLPTLDTLRFTNHDDAASTNVQPYFNSDYDLHLRIGNLAALAQYTGDVPTDIDGVFRPQIPSPTLGAHEYERSVHDIALVEIKEPTLLCGKTYVESDSFYVKVKLVNNGLSTESDVIWYAELDGVTGTRTLTRYISLMAPQQEIIDSLLIRPPLGVIDTQLVCAYVNCPVDTIEGNNQVCEQMFLDPAFNIKAVSVGYPEDNCRRYANTITISLQNVGKKSIPANFPFMIGYQAYRNTPTTVTIPTLPLDHFEEVQLNSELPVGSTRDVTFTTPANLYPTGTFTDISVKLRAWVNYVYDQKPNNDTTNYVTVQSFFTPATPEGTDLHLNYGTWGTITASQENSRPIKWYRDSLQSPFYEPNNYANSCHWNTPQYFYDSVYYLNAISTKNCPSYFGPVHVYINPRLVNDVSPEFINQPQRQRVYTEDDTVQVRIINYGTAPTSSFPVTYEISRRQGNNYTVIQTVTETCHLELAQDQTGIFTFDSLIQIPVEYRNQMGQYKLRLWTGLSTDQDRVNDTIMQDYLFTTLPESIYTTPSVGAPEGLDITRVSYNTLDNIVSEVGFTYTNFGLYNEANRIVPALHVARLTTDTMTIEVANNESSDDFRTMARLQVLIDYDRDGYFQTSEMIQNTLIRSRVPHQFVLTIPATAHYGYTKMRIIANMDTSSTTAICDTFNLGNVQDYLLYIEDDEEVPTTDLAVTRIVTPRDYKVDTSGYRIMFMIANKGSQPITSATVDYSFYGDNGFENSSFPWAGNLAPGSSDTVSLPLYHFTEGTTNLTIQVSVPGDTILANNTLQYQYHRFHVLKLVVEDNFDDDLNKWYAPQGKGPYNKNYWQKGNPQKSAIMGAYSEPNAWVTDSVSNIVAGKAGALCYLYSPIIDIIQIRPDTISFMLSKNLATGSHLRVEYLNFANRWVRLTTDSATAWYDDEEGFTGNTPNNNAYVRYQFSMKPVSGMFNNMFQLRFVYTAAPGSTDATSYANGCAFDDFRIGRAQRSKDLGVIRFVHPTEPRYGDIIYPTVTIRNFGYDTARMVQLAYRPFGSNIAVPGVYTGAIPPNGGTVDYTFETPFSVTNDYTDTFEMCSFTITDGDVYWENDSTCAQFVLAPLDTDFAMQAFVQPLPNVVAGDSIRVNVRIRNFGLQPMESVRLTYVFGDDTVSENLNFLEAMGEPLPSMEYYNFTFRKRQRATVGQMHIMAYGVMDHDNYRFNDTIERVFNGMQAVTDLEAHSIVLDTGNFTYNVVMLVINNVGARGANDFEVGYWYDKDTSNIFRETFHNETLLPALSTAYHTFSQTLDHRPAPYKYITAFVHAVGDNDNSNDTVSRIEYPTIDLEAVRLEIAEDSDAYCSVRLALKNVGTAILDRSWQKYTYRATINGLSLIDSANSPIAPGQTIHVDFSKKIPRPAYIPGMTREELYTSTARVSCSPDRNSSNNQTSEVLVLNHFEGVPLVTAGMGLSLEQNYPNPFQHQTNVQFHQPKAGNARFFVMDMTGRIVYQTSAFYPEGDHIITFSNTVLSSGLYFYGIESGNERQMRKMVIR